MAITKEIKEKGVKLEEAYVKANFVNFAVDIFADLEARKNGVLFDHKTISVPMNDKLYEVLKEAVFPESQDVDNSWKETKEKDEEVII
jgi:hypothetical protein